MTTLTPPNDSVRSLTIEEAVALQKASSPSVSPDGRLVAFAVGALSKTGEHATGAIHVVPTDGSGPSRPFTGGSGLDDTPRWSPDGTRLAFISDRHEHGKPALYVMPAAGGEARRLVTERGEVSDPRWSPDGARIAFLLKEVDTEDDEKRKKEGRDDRIVVDEEDKRTGLWVVEAASGTATRLSPTGLNVWAHAWSPAGDTIALLHTPTPKINEVYGAATLGVVALPTAAEASADGDGARVTTLCTVHGGAEALCWSPDGTRLAFVSGEALRPFTPSAATPIVVPAGGGEPRAVGAGHPAQFAWVDWLSNDDLIAVGVEDLDAAYYRVALDGGAAARLFADTPLVTGDPSDCALGADRATLVVVREDTASPGDLWAAHIASSHNAPIAAARLTTLNPELEGMAWGDVEQVTWTAPDGLDVHGLLIKPVGYEQGRRYPTVVHVHGGPAWLWSRRFYATWHDWDQFLSNRGYAVLLPNPRGSTGRGTAYVGANKDDVGGGEWQDVLAGARWAIESGIADPDRLGIGGWSWGGYMTAWAVTQTDLFKAAVMGAGLSNVLSDHGQNDIHDMNRLIFTNVPYDDPMAYWNVSPLKYVTRVTTPTLILHGQQDERVTPAQAQEFYRALKTRNIPVQFVLYPREPHGIAERAHQLDILRRVQGWFDTYLKNG